MIEIEFLSLVALVVVCIAGGAIGGILVYRNNQAKLGRVADAVEEAAKKDKPS